MKTEKERRNLSFLISIYVSYIVANDAAIIERYTNSAHTRGGNNILNKLIYVYILCDFYTFPWRKENLSYGLWTVDF